MTLSVRLGIRLQLLIALGALLVLAFVPLFFAVASLTRASMVGVRESSARSLGRAIGGHVIAAADRRSNEDLLPLLQAQVGQGGVDAIAVYGPTGRKQASAGELDSADALPLHVEPGEEAVRSLETRQGRALLVVVPGRREGSSEMVSVATLLPTGAAAASAGPLVRLMSLYIGVVALALLVFAYFSMTRLVVRPVLALSESARRVADGARTIERPRDGARELLELGASLSSMTRKLRNDEETLRTKVEELESARAELLRAQQTLIRSERLASVGRLAAGVAHEIGNPIAAILGFQELMLADDLDAEEQRDFLVRMKKETERINRVLRDLLDFARPVQAPDEGEVETGDVAQAITDAFSLVQPQRQFHDLDLIHEIEEDLPLVTLSTERIIQVLLNLLLNAADALGEGAAKDGRIVLRAVRLETGDEQCVSIQVEDNGPGISPDVADKLFEPFVSTKDVGKGSGLGLAVCRGLVEAVGGTIAITAAAEGGARFAIMLPIVERPAPSEA